ncbi:3-keto-5-aminohexanoate cleavage protein [Variovorax sp. J22P240]|uniref:3-keto-5-aminohexanoate cleavage protein n=1 Tax=Variovorax sp. J22P240 TaxID=3053514 RepID=UPI002576C477|nr:3-keto-5-aminohexanoate cleavage protein [Variovorax sp. J22P240]MDM0000686.1 3-keto-5-aminohexanoate cleavage protein [Variovorax sp. J22P240]
MHFLDDSLLPENQQKLVIQVAPYGPQWVPGDSDDIPVTMDQQVQKAVDCWNAGATVLHVHVREEDGKGSKRLSKFNELLARLREAVPQMILQVGGSISFAPETEGEAAKWLNDDTRHMLAELTPRPDQVTVVVNTTQMNIMELMTEADIAGTSLTAPGVQAAYRDMVVPANPSWYEEHIRRLVANGIQPLFMLGGLTSLESVERLVRRGAYCGPLILNYVAIGGGASGVHPADMLEFARRTPDGAVLTIETLNRNVFPMNAMAIALGMHVRVGIEDTLFGPTGERMSSVQQIESMVRMARELNRDVASGEEARQIYRLGETYRNADQTLAKLGYAPNRAYGERGFPLRQVA